MTAEQKKKLALKNMVRFRNEPHYAFWRNVYQYPEGKEENMSLWLNGRNPSYMESTEGRDLNCDKIRRAVACMSYEGLQCAAIGFFAAMNRIGMSPKDMVEVITLGLPEKQTGKYSEPPLHFPAA